MMLLLRVIFTVGIFLFGIAAVFMGAVMSLAFLKSGVISLSWGEGADQSRDVMLSTAPQEFWFYFSLLGVLPVVAGIAAIVAARRMERSN